MGTGYFDQDAHGGDVEASALDGRTPLDRTIDRIGMGSYQWVLLSLCGFGWMADNMWLEAIAIALGRVQRHFAVSDRMIGALPSSMNAGMMLGAIGWGACSDLLGRIAAFNGTLVLTAVFGLTAVFAPSFPLLCVTFVFLGSAVGGSMPTDGTLLLENIPRSKQYLVTALSAFFSLGAVLSAVVALVIVPPNSCPPEPAPCDIDTENRGWQYLLATLSVITTCLFAGRVIFFTLYESPRYLVRAGREQDAVQALQMIAKYNGNSTPIGLADVHDQVPATADSERAPFLSKDGDDTLEAPPRPHHAPRMASTTGLFDGSEVKGYESAIQTPVSSPPIASSSSPSGAAEDDEDIPPARPRTSQRRSTFNRTSMLASQASYRGDTRTSQLIPKALRGPFDAWLDKVSLVLAPEWRRTTILVWINWFAMSIAFTMFNVFLPKLIESAGDVAEQKSITESLWDVVIFTIGGFPGALIGAWMVDAPYFGRRRSLAFSTFATALGCAVFAGAKTPIIVRTSSMFIALASTTMYAVLYSWTPEIFQTETRGSACGIASALSRVGGMIAPLVGGFLLDIDRALPVYTSVVIFVLAGICTLLIHEDAGKGKGSEGPSLMH